MKEGENTYWDNKFMKESLKSHADVVMVMIGTNDSKQWDKEKFA
jgi:lysophospholipase L1-like esterase